MKTSPLAFHPINAPFSSSPKGAARRGHPGAAWLGHPTPLRGALGAGPPSKKTFEGLVPHSDHGHLGQGVVDHGASSLRTTWEGGQGDRQCVRSRKVQPVHKQLVSRTNFSLGDARCPPGHVPDSGRGFAEQCAAAWTRVPPQQEDREQHLRLYHQQFQQPPILQEKLNYQPLEKLLGQYKPQEVRVQPEPPGPPPASPQGQDETMQLEDLDDSDFSEDSFSPGPSRRKPEAEAAEEGGQRSFFLHQRERGTGGREVQVGQELFFELLESKEEASPRTEEAVSCEESTKSPSDWSTGEASVLDSSPENDTPEKPYCLQEDSTACNGRDAGDPSVGRNRLLCIDLDQGCSGESLSRTKKATQILPFAPQVLGPTRCFARRQREDSVKGCSGNLEKGLPEGSDLSGSLGFSLDFAAGAGTPLMVSLLGSERGNAVEEEALDQGHEEEREGKESFSPQTQAEEDPGPFLGSKASLPGLACDMDPCRRQTAQPCSSQAKWLPQVCHGPKVLSSLGEASPLGELCGRVCGFSAGDAGLAQIFSPWKGKEGPLLLGNLQGGEGAADTEATMTALLSGPGQLRLGEKDCPEPMTAPKHDETREKAFGSRASENQEPSGESLGLQPSLEAHKTESGCSQGQFKLTFNSEETGLSKDKSVSEASVQRSLDAAEQDSGTNIRSPQSSPKGTSKSLFQCKEASGR